MNGHSLRIATATATEESQITAIMKPAMIAIMHDEPKFSELFVAYLLTRNSRVEDDLIDQLFNSSEKQLSRLLLLLAKFGRKAAQHWPPSMRRCCIDGLIKNAVGKTIRPSEQRLRYFDPAPKASNTSWKTH